VEQPIEQGQPIGKIQGEPALPAEQPIQQQPKLLYDSDFALLDDQGIRSEHQYRDPHPAVDGKDAT
jgi:hypothetical protein